MRVRVQVTVDIDEEAWAAEYGVLGLSAIRADVRKWGNTLVIETLRDLGLLEEG